VIRLHCTDATWQAGDSEIDMIFKIFQLLGTPNEQTWPGVEALPDFSTAFPKWPAQVLTKKVQPLEGSPGVELLKVRAARPLWLLAPRASYGRHRATRICDYLHTLICVCACMRACVCVCLCACPAPLTRQLMLTYNPATRISAKVALQHPYFECLKK
jgi:hypothetical protein